MNKFAILSVVGVMITAWFLSTSNLSGNALESEFQSFMAQYGKSYNSQAELDFRMKVFKENMEEAAYLQSLNPKARFGATKFSDWTKEEFSRLLTEYSDDLGDYIEEYTKTSSDTTPKTWVKDFEKIQNQGSCGSCWTFAAAATYEAYRSIRGEKQVKLAEQELVDCVPACSGCNGGLANLAYDWLVQNEFCTEKSYPYEARDASCRKSSCQSVDTLSNDKGSGLVTVGEPGIISKIQNDGPVSISVDASVWHNYQGGVLQNGCGMQTNHAVVVVGLDNHDGVDHWVIRNSWDKQWGEKGYMWMEIGKNLCNIERRPSYPVF
jgi:C1A family cysteine protease